MSRSRRIVGSVLSLSGSVVVVVGTFAPWLTSGGVDRNSYAIAGIVDRLGLAGHGFGAVALNGWPFVGPIAMLGLIAAILRWWRTSAWIAMAFGVLAGIIGGGVMAVAGGHAAVGIMLAGAGPTITVIGAALSIVGGSVVLVPGRRRPVRVATSPGGFVPVTGEPSGDPSRPSGQRVQTKCSR